MSDTPAKASSSPSGDEGAPPPVAPAVRGFRVPIWVVLLLVALGLGGFAYYRFDALSGIETEARAKLEEADKKQRTLEAGQDLAEDAKAIEDALARIETRLIKPGDLASNLQYFFRLAEEVGVRIPTVNQLPPPTAPRGPARPYSRVPFNLVVVGPYPKVLIYLRRLERGSAFANLQGANLRADATGTATLEVSLELLGTNN